MLRHIISTPRVGKFCDEYISPPKKFWSAKVVSSAMLAGEVKGKISRAHLSRETGSRCDLKKISVFWFRKGFIETRYGLAVCSRLCALAHALGNHSRHAQWERWSFSLGTCAPSQPQRRSWLLRVCALWAWFVSASEAIVHICIATHRSLGIRCTRVPIACHSGVQSRQHKHQS